MFLLILLVSCGVASAVFAGEPPSGGRVVVRDGVTHVMNPEAGLQPPQVIATTELWRRGGEDDDVVFAEIGAVTRDRAGNTYLLDVQRNEIHVIAPDGRYAGTVGREGEGPGEFRMASGLGLLSDSVLCVTQAVPARAVLLSCGGKAMGDHPLAPELVGTFINGSTVVGGRLAICSGQTVREKTAIGFRTVFGILDESGRLSKPSWEMVQKADFANMVFDEKTDVTPVWAFAADGRFFVNKDWDGYAIEVVAPGGGVERVIERVYAHRPRTRSELDLVEARKQAGDMPPETKVSPTSRDIVRLVPRSDGHLWVLSSRGDMDGPAGVVAMFDEFDEAGAFIRPVTLRGPRQPQADEFYMVDDIVIVVTNAAPGAPEDAGEVEIVCLRMAGAR